MSDNKVPNPELVVHDGIIRAVNMVSTLHGRLDCEELTDDHLKALDDIRTHLLGVSLIGYDPAAASSPVVRPRHFYTCACQIDVWCYLNQQKDIFTLDDKPHICELAEPVVRTQPTPDENYLDGHSMWTKRAAPVAVEPRRTHPDALEPSAALTIANNAGLAVDYFGGLEHFREFAGRIVKAYGQYVRTSGSPFAQRGKVGSNDPQ